MEAVEKNAQARAFAKEHFGLDVKPDTALQDFAPGSFDVITLWHVMEHLEHLNETWDTLNSLLTEKGVLIIAVPNCSSYDAKKYGAHWAAYDVPRHLWHFTPGTIQRLGAKHEFILAARHPMPFDAFYVSMLSEKYMGHSMSFFRGILSGTGCSRLLGVTAGCTRPGNVFTTVMHNYNNSNFRYRQFSLQSELGQLFEIAPPHSCSLLTAVLMVSRT